MYLFSELNFLIVIPLLVLLHISTWLAPFMTYHFFTGDEGDSVLLAFYQQCQQWQAESVADPV